MKQQVIQKKSNSEITFFPRIIREFEDDDEPMYYGAKAFGVITLTSLPKFVKRLYKAREEPIASPSGPLWVVITIFLFCDNKFLNFSAFSFIECKNKNKNKSSVCNNF